MQTPTHLLIAASVLARPGHTVHNRWRNAAILFGATLPDLSIFIMYFWSRIIQGVPEERIWNEVYWTPFWQGLVMIGNSFPIFAALAVLAWFRQWVIAYALALAALLHIAFDFPFHNDDAHVHFWPLTTWRFESPLSYYDPDHFGLYVAGVEFALAIAMIAVLWQRFPAQVPRTALLVALALYVAVPAYFIWQLGTP